MYKINMLLQLSKLEIIIWYVLQRKYKKEQKLTFLSKNDNYKNAIPLIQMIIWYKYLFINNSI